MHYHACGNRCAFDLSELALPTTEAYGLITTAGFRPVEVDVVALARECIGVSRYVRGTASSHAPNVLDCSSLVKWAYARKGVWVPRLSVQQCVHGVEVALDALVAGDVLVTDGVVNFHLTDPSERIGHVGIATGEGTVVHAGGPRYGVREVPLERFLHRRTLHSVRRYCTPETITLELPEGFVVERSDDILWHLRKALQ